MRHHSQWSWLFSGLNFLYAEDMMIVQGKSAACQAGQKEVIFYDNIIKYTAIKIMAFTKLTSQQAITLFKEVSSWEFPIPHLVEHDANE